MKLSIMITCYNCEQYIDSAIQSAVSQELPFEWELLVGDDGSNDRTLEIVEAWKIKFPQNIKVFVMPREKNESKNGTRAAKNRANLLRHAQGEYLTFLDGDDCFSGEEILKRQIEILENPKNQKCACVAHDIWVNDISVGKVSGLVKDELKEGPVNSDYYWKNLYFHTNTIVFRRKCIELMLNKSYADFLNDNFITYIILQYGNIYYIPEIYGFYNLTGDGLWTGKNRTYGCFRNMIIYDLERLINPSMAKASLIRHIYDFRYIFKYYKKDDKERIKSLVDTLDRRVFANTFLLYSLNDDITAKDRVKIFMTNVKVQWIFQARRIKSHLFRNSNRSYL